MRRQRHADPIAAELEDAFEPGEFVGDMQCFSFVDGLEEAIGEIAALPDSEAERAALLYETVLAGCYLKAEELDDSSGRFGMFVKDIVGLWIQAHRKAGAAAGETAATLLAWMDRNPYGYWLDLEGQVSTVFDSPGLAALETLVRARYEQAIRPLDGNGRRWRGLLRAIYLKQGRADAYERIAAEAGYPADDCLALARLHSGDDAVLALRWVERGLAAAEKTPYAAGPYALVPMRRELLARLGREDEALASAWEDFLRRSTTDALEELLQYAPAGEREAWRERALESAQGPVREKLELLAGTGDTVRIAAVTEAASDAELEGISHFLTEPAATMLEPERPFLAGRLWRAQALRILNAGKSRYYDAALDNLERARDCFRRAGREAEWEKTVMELSRAHARKQGFTRGLAAVARGESRVRPSFLETAMAKWTKRDGQ